MQAAGIRTDPPPSVPMDRGPIPAATAAPAPPEEPPGVRSVFQGFRVIPLSGESVTPLNPYSGLELEAKITVPASRNRETVVASSVCGVLSVSLLAMVRGQPFTRISSLIETGTPSMGDRGSPFAHRASEARAWTRAPSASMRGRALSTGFSRAARSSTASRTSTGEALRAA